MVAVVREDSEDDAKRVAEAFVAAGLPVIEITLTTPGAETLMSTLARDNPGLVVAAGTVLTENAVARAHRVGASVIVSPHFDPAVVSATLNAGMLSVAGAGSVTEIVSAHRAGAHLIKVYPAKSLGGPAFIRTIRQPIRGIEMVAGGPVGLDEIEDYLEAGCTAVNLGQSIAPPDSVRGGDWATIRDLASRALAISQLTEPNES